MQIWEQGHAGAAAAGLTERQGAVLERALGLLVEGGERALTAISILFAMLELKPTPFCFLDEIEAALDDANIDNFADYLKDYSLGTQFVVVTHRKGTMERCDSLYGVSMEEKGVSKVVSARFGEDGITTAPEQAS